MDLYNIGEAAARSGVSAKMIRHYEEMGLIVRARRTAAGYRTCTEADLHTLRFIRQSREPGLSIRQIGELLGLWQNRRRRSTEVKALALAHLQELEGRIAEIQAVKTTLEHLVHCCDGNERPDCPILDRLADAESHCGSAGRSARRLAPSRHATTPPRVAKRTSSETADSKFSRKVSTGKAFMQQRRSVPAIVARHEQPAMLPQVQLHQFFCTETPNDHLTGFSSA